jgi:hypothetical protein
MNATDHFYVLIKPLFPKGSHIKSIGEHTDQLVFRIDWRVHEEGRPAKRSRPILLKISRDVLDDYRDDPRSKTTMDASISVYIAGNLASYIDDGVAAPAVEWHIAPDNTYAAPRALLVQKSGGSRSKTK